ncbi:AI-2E family transporter [Microbacterium lacticum]
MSEPRDSMSPEASAEPAPDATTVALENATPRRTIWANLNHPFVIGFFLTLGGLVAFALGAAVSSLVTIWIYIAFAMFAALGLDPLVRRLENRGMRRGWAITVVYFVLVLVLVAIIWLIVPTVISQIAQFIRDIPGMIGDFQRSDLFAWLSAQFGDQVPDLLADLQKFLTDPNNVAAIGGGVLSIGVTIGSTISGVIIIIVLSLYFLASLPEIKQAFYRLWPARLRPVTSELTEKITTSVGGYLGGMVVLAFFNALVAFLLYLFLGLPFPALMAVVAFSLTLIPLVGSVLFWAVGTVIALIASPLGGLVFAIVYLVYMQIEAYVLTPKVMSKAISVPGALVVIGALVGGTLMGLLGALVAIPVTASILLIIKTVYIPKQDAAV